MNTASLVVIVLVALLIGASIPVLVQLRATLKATQKGLEALRQRLDTILEDSQVVAKRLARVSDGLEGGEDSIRDLMLAIRRVSGVMNRSSSWIGIASSLGAAVGPSVAAAVQAYRSRQSLEEEVEGAEQGESTPWGERSGAWQEEEVVATKAGEPPFAGVVEASRAQRERQVRREQHAQ